jgi:CBS-domain-containing membrane protein
MNALTSISGDCELQEALKLMDSEGVTSLAVIDSAANVVGNISTVDVKVSTLQSAEQLAHDICSCLQTRALCRSLDRRVSTSFPSFCLNVAWKLARTLFQSFMSIRI